MDLSRIIKSFIFILNFDYFMYDRIVPVKKYVIMIAAEQE